jgi:phosphoglucosamine mutase
MLLTAVQVFSSLAIVGLVLLQRGKGAEAGAGFGAGASGMQKFPQVLLNVKVAKRFDPAGVPAVQEAMARIERTMAGEGRVVLRPSCTEPVIRVMVEGRDEGVTRAAATELADVVKAAASG